MDGAKKVMVGGLLVIGVIIIGPMVPGMLAKTTKGMFSLAGAFGEGASMAYGAGRNAGKKSVIKGINKPI
ncbi:hypothetical protein N9N26_00865 [Candidatus Poseidoniales archaeon]|jgi:hypothetical protein|nr:hypothetical protein [Candidatus Poseidoniales archaeon]